MNPFLTEWKVLLSFSHITRSQCQRPSPLQTFRSQSEVLSPLPAGGLWLAFPVETYSVLNRKAQTSTMLSTEKMLSMLPVTTVATTEQSSSVYEDIFLSPRLQQSVGFSSELCLSTLGGSSANCPPESTSAVPQPHNQGAREMKQVCPGMRY